MNFVKPVWLGEKKFLKELPKPRDKFAVLCGSGISGGAGLPIAREFMKGILKHFFQTRASDFLKPKPLKGVDLEVSKLRFEGLLEVLQRTVDYNLKLLNMCYFPPESQSRVPQPTHHYLAAISRKHPVVTPNFDTLIEEAMEKSKQFSVHSAGSSHWFSQVFYGSSHWKKSVLPTANGLWKIHGTIKKWNASKGWVDPVNERPVATLSSIGRSRRDDKRRRKFESILQNYPLVVVGYSASDDFDISNWLREIKSNQKIFWIVFKGNTQQLGDPIGTWRKLGGGNWKNVYLLNADGDQKVVDKVLRKLANTSSQPKESSNWKWKEALNDWIRNYGSSDWQKHIVAGEILKHCSRYNDAIAEFMKAKIKAGHDKNKRAIAQMLLAEAQLEIAEKSFRKMALVNAKEALRSLPSDRWKNAAKVAYATALRLAPRHKKEKEAIKLLKEVIDDPKSNFFELSRSILELRRLVSRADIPNPYSSAEWSKKLKISKADLFMEALNKHEDGRNKILDAKKEDEILKAIAIMDSAIQLREQLGDWRNWCASKNVQGVMYRRLSEIQYENGKNKEANISKKKAFKSHKQSFDLANEKLFCFDFDRSAAQLNLCVYHLRLEGDLKQAQKAFKIANKYGRRGNRPAEDIRLEIFETLFKIAKLKNISNAIKVGNSRFKNLEDRISNQLKNEGINLDLNRLHYAIKINRMACGVMGPKNPGSFKQLVKGLQTPDDKNKYPYFQKRIENIGDKLTGVRAPPDLARILLDSLP